MDLQTWQPLEGQVDDDSIPRQGIGVRVKSWWRYAEEMRRRDEQDNTMLSKG